MDRERSLLCWPRQVICFPTRTSGERVLGRGGFSFVYLAHDEHLQRFLDSKVPRRASRTCNSTTAGNWHPRRVPDDDKDALDGDRL